MNGKATIHPFKHWTVCPKCGGDDINRAYCTDGWPSYDHQDFPGDRREQEHFDLLCRGCHFEWYEQTKDAAMPTKEEASNVPSS